MKTTLSRWAIILIGLLIVTSFQLGSRTRIVYAEQGQPVASPEGGIPEGYRLIEGDILVPELLEFETEAAYTITRFWPRGTVNPNTFEIPFEFDINVTAANQNLMRAAMAVWENVANVEFILRTTQTDFIHIQNSTRNSSAVGRQGGQQELNITSWGAQFVIVHELGHALGLWHEQSREDRDNFIVIEEARISQNTCGTDNNSPCDYNFERHEEADVYPPNEYDFDSLMHYNQCAFSCCDQAVAAGGCCPQAPNPCLNCAGDPANCRTITVLPPWDAVWQNAIGQRTHLSRFDAMTMSFLYPETDWIFVDQSGHHINQNGSFILPYTLFASGASAVPAGGTVIVQPGDYKAVGSYAKAMTLRAPLGDVILGN